MIKLEEKQISEIEYKNFHICLSPFCFNPQNRIFLPECLQNQQMYSHNKQQCAKWVITLFELLLPTAPYKVKQFSNLELNFNEQPIQTLRKIARLDKSDWKKQLTKQINTIKKQINNTLEVLEQNILSKVTEILEKKRFISEIQELIEKNFTKPFLSKKMNQKPSSINQVNNIFPQMEAEILTNQLNKYLYSNSDTISQLKSVHFLQKAEIKEEMIDLKKKIQDLQKKLLEEKSKIKARTQERVEFYEWMFQKDDNMFNKLQAVGNLFNMKQQNFHIEKETIRINCLFCPKYVLQKVVPQNIKQIKKFMCEQLNIHMYNEHHDRIFYSYLKKVSKSKCKEMTISELLSQLESIEQLHLVDRETGMSYTEDFVSSDIFSIDILTKKNAHLAKNNYILIESKQAINSFVSILAFECSSQKKKLLVVSNRFQHFQQICKIFSFANVQTTKKYDGFQRIKFQQEKTISKLESSTVKKST